MSLNEPAEESQSERAKIFYMINPRLAGDGYFEKIEMLTAFAASEVRAAIARERVMPNIEKAQERIELNEVKAQLAALKILLTTREWGAAYGAVCEDYPELVKLVQEHDEAVIAKYERMNNG